METLVLVLRLALAGVFLVAGAAKLRDVAGSRQALEEFGLPARLAGPGGVVLPLCEIAIGLALLLPPYALAGALAATALLAAFAAAIVNAMAHGRAPDCHCFGQLHSEPAGWSTLVRNGVLIALAVPIVLAGPGPAVDGWLRDRTDLELAALALGLTASVPLAFGIRELFRRREARRATERYLAEVEAAQRPPGRPLGTPAPAFAVRALTGEELTLDALRLRRKPVVLVFVHPACETCRELLPRLGEWQITLADRLTIAVLSEGDVESNRDLAEKHGIAHFLVQRGAEVYDAYKVRATPSAVVVDPDGTIASPTPLGQLAIEELVRQTLRRSESWTPTPVS